MKVLRSSAAAASSARSSPRPWRARGQLRGQPIAQMTLADLAAPKAVAASFPVEGRAVDITDAGQVRGLIEARPDVIYHLAAIVSGQAEAEFDLGWSVNLFGSYHVFEAARHIATRPIVVFTSSIAVYGGEIEEPIEDWTHLNPQTSYGAQKAASELMLNDYSRKGFFDGRGLRLPTISIRPGKPNKAASGFMSSIFREPLARAGGGVPGFGGLCALVPVAAPCH